MNKVKTLYARFLSPGSFVADDWTAPVVSADPLTVKWPDRAYAFTLHEREDVIDGDKTYEGKPRQIGPTYYHPDSKVESLDEVKATRSAERILISNMECNDWSHIIWSRWGNWPQPFDPKNSKVLPKP